MGETTYDVGLDADGDIPVFCRHITGPTLTAQRLTIRLQTFFGEWHLDTRKGLPFLDWIQQKPPDLASIGATIRAAVLEDPNITRIEDYDATWDPDAQSITVSFVAWIEDVPFEFLIQPLGDSSTGNSLPSVIFMSGYGAIAP